MNPETVSMISAGIALLAASGSWGAVIASRRNAADAVHAQVNTGARTSRATVVSANRQKWIDAIRDDIAEYISLRKLEHYREVHRIMSDASLISPKEQIEIIVAKERILARIEMRLKWTGPNAEEDHKDLIAALHRYANHYDDENKVKEVATKIFKDEWERLKKEASGIDPFVREAVRRRE